MTLRDLQRAAYDTLRAAGFETPEIDVRVLLKFSLRLDDAELVSASNISISKEQQSLFEVLLARRLSGEPIAGIVGQKEFWSRSFKLAPDTLVPRPETETLVEAALALFPSSDSKFYVLDLGVGSGILLGVILMERKNAEGIGIDRSENALRTSHENLAALGVRDRATLICSDWSAALNWRFDLVVTNPPYIESKAITLLSREVREYDPLLALDGGEDGLTAYREIVVELPHLLSDRGFAVLELGKGQEPAVTALAHSNGLHVEACRSDLSGVPRALILSREVRK